MLHPTPPASPVTEHHLAPEISFQRTRSHSNRSLLKGLALFSRMRMTQKPLACQKERLPNLTPTPNLMLVLENTPSPAPSLPTVPLTSPLLGQEALFFQDVPGTLVPVTGSPLSRPTSKRISIALQDFSVSGISETQSNLGTLQSASSLLALALLGLGPKTSINHDGQREPNDPPYEDSASEPEINLSVIWADYLSLSQASLDTKYTASALPAGESACIAPSPSLDWPNDHSTATDHDQEPDLPTLPSTNADFRDAMAELSLALSQLPRTPYNSPDAVSFLPNSGSSMVRLSSVLARLVAEGLGALGPQALSSSVAIVEDGDDASRVEEGEDAEETNATCVKHGLDAQAEEGDSTHANVSHDRGDARMSLGLVDGAKPETGALQEHMDGPTESESQPLDLGSMLVLFPSPPQQPFEWLVEESCSTPRTPRRGQRRQGATFSWLDDKQCGELRGLGICV